MSDAPSLALAFTTGLLGAGHCLGMCCGLAGGLFLGLGWRRVWAVAGYHLARIATYVVLGTTGAWLGRVLVQTATLGKLQGILMMLAGVLITALGLRRLLRAPAATCPPQRAMSAGPLVAGLLNGLVPCSLVFSIAVKAAATADPLQASLLMLAFGLGTLPAMGLLSLFAGGLGHTQGDLIRRLGGVAVLALGCWTLYQGWVFFDVMRGLAG